MDLTDILEALPGTMEYRLKRIEEEKLGKAPECPVGLIT